jgi:hypothetical protein
MSKREHLKTVIPLEKMSGQPIRKTVMTGVNGLLEKILSVDAFESLYHTLPPCTNPFQFLENTLDRLQMEHGLEDEARRSIPPSGPAIVVPITPSEVSMASYWPQPFPLSEKTSGSWLIIF